MRDQTQTEPLLDGPWFMAARACLFVIVVFPATQAFVGYGLAMFISKGEGQLCIRGHRVSPPTAQAERVACAVQSIGAMEQGGKRTDAVTPQGRRRHGEPVSAFQGNQRIPYRDVLWEGDIIVGLPADIHGKAGRLQVFVAHQFVRRAFNTMGTTLRPGWTGAVAAAVLATPHPAQGLNFWCSLLVRRYMPVQGHSPTAIHPTIKDRVGARGVVADSDRQCASRIATAHTTIVLALLRFSSTTTRQLLHRGGNE